MTSQDSGGRYPFLPGFGWVQVSAKDIAEAVAVGDMVAVALILADG
jgi:hypothetical protein